MSFSIVKIGQNCAAILNQHTPSNIQYIYTDGFRSCVGIVAKGSEGVAVIHDGGKLSSDSLVAILKKIGKIEFWTTVFNPNVEIEYQLFFPERYQQLYGEKGVFETKFPRIQQLMDQVVENAASKYRIPEGKSYYPAALRYAYINREGEIYTQNTELSSAKMIPQPDFSIREATCHLNHSFMEEGQFFDCHLQFDGSKFTNLPQLLHTSNTIKEMAKTDSVIKDLRLTYLERKTAYDNFKDELDGIQRKYTGKLDQKIVSAEVALRRAASDGDIQSIQFLVEQAGIDVNSQGPTTGKTALDQAAEKGHDRVMGILCGYGARNGIKDREGKIANI